MAKKYHIQNLGIKFLIVGILCLFVSFLIQAIYIRNTDFKTQFKDRQHKTCLKNNSVTICDQNFPVSE